MLAGHQDFRKLADAIGKKLASDPEKYRQIARETEPYFGCGGDYSFEAPCLSESEAYGRALNQMHYAVSGSRPYSEEGEEGEQPGSSEPRTGVCITPIIFICNFPDHPFVCSGDFSCTNVDGFSCRGVGFMCRDAFNGCTQRFSCTASFGCVPPDAFNMPGCPSFTCPGLYL